MSIFNLFGPKIDLSDVAVDCTAALNPFNTKGSDSETDLSVEGFEKKEDSQRDPASVRASAAAKKTIQRAREQRSLDPKFPEKEKTYTTIPTTQDLEESEKATKLIRLQVKYRGKLQELSEGDLKKIKSEVRECKTSRTVRQVLNFIGEINVALSHFSNR